MSIMSIDLPKPHRRWPDYAALWRWHFYAGLLCLPFFCWLAITGSLYLFRPDIEAWLDKPYENLTLSARRALPSAEAAAAVRAVSGSTFSRYEPPAMHIPVGLSLWFGTARPALWNIVSRLFRHGIGPPSQSQQLRQCG